VTAGLQRDAIESFYDRHPYPPPVRELGGPAETARVAHHRIWPARPVDSIASVLVAGCGTSQAVRHALRRPAARVIGIDVSAASLEHTRALSARHGVENLELHVLPIEAVEELGERFDHVVCTGVLHHLADPALGLRALRAVLAPGGAVTLMVYARYGRAGVYLIQEYCRRLGVGPDGLEDLVATLREIPPGHPLRPLLRSPDFAADSALADVLCNPRDRAYKVPELLELIRAAGLRFGRWERQAPYLPDCGAITETPHAARIAALAPEEQYAAMELFRGTMARHTAIAFAGGAAALDFGDPAAAGWVPIRVSTAIAVQERLPAEVAAALLNRAHSDTDLVLFADRREHELFCAIDGERTIAQLGDVEFVERLWRHDLVVVDAS
jgi:SAM-dependent methyltransferase